MRQLLSAALLICSFTSLAPACEFCCRYNNGYYYDQWGYYPPAVLSTQSSVFSNNRLPDGTYVFSRYKVRASPYPEQWRDPYSVPTWMPGQEKVVVDGESLDVYRLQSEAGKPLSIGSGKVKTLKTKDGKPRKVFVVE